MIMRVKGYSCDGERASCLNCDSLLRCTYNWYLLSLNKVRKVQLVEISCHYTR